MTFRSSILVASCCAGLACSGETTGPVVIRFWAMGNEGENVRTLIPEFERRNPGIKVVVQQMPWTAAHEKLLTAFAGESTPDVCQLGNTWLPEFTVLKSLEPLDGYVAGSKDMALSDFFPGVLRTNILDSTLYGIPWYVDTRVMFYRRDMLASVGAANAPETWAEVERVGALLKAKYEKDGKKHYPFFLPTNEWVPAIVMGMQAGGRFLKDENTRGNFSGPEFRKAFTLLAQLYTEGYSPSGMSLITNMYTAFSEGLIAMYITGPWNIGEFSRRIPPSQQDAWMTAPLPSMDSTRPGVSLPLGTSLVIFRRSAHKTEAWKLIEFLASRDQSVAFYRITGSLPPRQSAWSDTSLTRQPAISAFYRQLQRVEPLPQVPEWEQIVIKLQLYVEYVATGTLSVDEAVKRFDTEVDQMLEKRRWLLTKQEGR